MVTAESLCCGTPVVGFKAGGPETIALLEWSCFVEYGDAEELHKQLLHCLNRAREWDEAAKRACEAYSADTMCRDYVEQYRMLVQ